MVLSEVLQTCLRVAHVLEGLGVDYLVGGSLASSLHGIPRATQDVDLVANMKQDKVEAFVAALAQDFFVDEEMIREAIRQNSSFNIIELASMFKVDVFLSGTDDVSRAEMTRRQPVQPGDDPRETLMIASPEDIILQKLAWYRKGGEVSDRQWLDALGVLKVQGTRLEQAYLQTTARMMEIDDLLERALSESGL